MSETMSDGVNTTCPGEVSIETEVGCTPPNPVDTAFITKSWRDDLALIVEDKPLYVNRCTLACLSSVFDAMFCSSDTKEEITLTGKKYDDFLEFLQCIYPGKGKSITYDNVFKVAPLAHKYQVKQLQSVCDDFLVQHLSNMESPNEVYQILALSSASKMDKITAKCIEIVAERPEDEIEESKSEFSYPEELLHTLAAKMLHSLKTKYKDVFGHVKTSRALYEFLGIEAKQTKLVEGYKNGRVIGDILSLELHISSLNASTEMYIGGKEFTFDVTSPKTLHDSDIRVCVKCRLPVELDEIKCLCSVRCLNWMRNKESIGQVFEFCLRKHYAFTEYISVCGCKPSLLRNEVAGFVCNNGYIKMQICLFCI